MYRGQSLLLLLLFLHPVCASAVENEQINARTYVPSTTFAQGEVRLLLGEEGATVQSLLCTRFTKRATKQIGEKESQNWGDHPDATAYVNALAEVMQEYDKRRDGAQKEIALLVSIVDAFEAGRVDFSIVSVTKDEHGYHVNEDSLLETLRSLPVSETYIRKNQEFILLDAFKKRGPELVKRVQELRADAKGVSHE